MSLHSASTNPIDHIPVPIKIKTTTKKTNSPNPPLDLNQNNKLDPQDAILALQILSGVNPQGISTTDGQIIGIPNVIAILREIAKSKSIPNIIVNEIMGSNSKTITDKDGDYPDYIELYNPSDQEVNLAGWGLSDRENSPKWFFPKNKEVIIKPKSYLLIFASGKNINNPNLDNGEYFHTNFKISKDGEPIVLTKPDGTLSDAFPAKEMTADISAGRKDDGNLNPEAIGYFDVATPGTTNNTATIYQGYTPSPEFSVSAGIYKEPITLTFNNIPVGTNIYYTLDGSDPDKNSTLYTANTNIQIDKTTVIKARAFKAEGFLPSPIITNTYIFFDREVTLPIVSLSTNPESFFGKDGIYNKSIEALSLEMIFYKDKKEVPITFELFKRNGERELVASLGAQIKGFLGSLSRPQRTIGLYARSEYGDKLINHPLFPGNDVQSFNNFFLRNGGDDWTGNISNAGAHFRDAFIHYQAKNTVDGQDYRPAIVFINGRYWGIQNFREKYSEHYIRTHYAIDIDKEVNLLESSIYNSFWINYADLDDPIFDCYFDPDPQKNQEIIENLKKQGQLFEEKRYLEVLQIGGFIKANSGNKQGYLKLISHIFDNDFSSPQSYSELDQIVDTSNFINYLITEIYAHNLDWPWNNLRFWQEENGKWYCLLVDLDSGLRKVHTEDNMFDFLYNKYANQNKIFVDTSWVGVLSKKLIYNNQQFRKELIDKFLVYLNTVFDPEVAQAKLEQFKTRIESEMNFHLERWGEDGQYSFNINDWQEKVDDINYFVKNRPEHLRSHLADFFDLNGTTTSLKLEVSASEIDNHGKIAVNNTDLPDSYDPSGTYFTNRDIKLEAIAKDGYQFKEWQVTDSSGNNISGIITEGDINSPIINIQLNTAAKIKAVFATVP